MVHLGTQISALADGRLGPAGTERALGHVAACPECSAELAVTRAARAALANAMDVPVARDLAPRLLALSSAGSRWSSGGAGPDRGGRSAEPRTLRQNLEDARQRLTRDAVDAPSVPMPGSQREPLRDCLRGEVGRRGLPVRSLTAAAVGIVVVGLFVAGEEQAVAPARHPAQALALLAAADGLATEVGLLVTPVSSAAGTAGTAGTAADDVSTAWPALPDGYQVVSVHDGTAGTEMDLDGPYGTVVLIQQAGRLDSAAVQGAPVAQVGGHDVRVLSTAPLHVVWQSGDTVLGIVAGGLSPAVEALVAAYPAEPFDDGFAAQVSRGWQTLAGAWSP